MGTSNSKKENPVEHPGVKLPIDTDNLYWDKYLHEVSNNLIVAHIPQYTDMCQWELYYYLQAIGILTYLCVDDFVTEYVRAHYDVALFQLELTSFAQDRTTKCNKHRVTYAPAPNNTILDLENIKVDFELITKVCKEIKDNIKMSDIDIVNEYGFELYQVIKFVLYNNRNVTLKLNHTLHDDKIKIYEVIHNDMKEKDFNGSHYYHGSPIFNWHSIINNGFEVYTGSKVLNAAAHGNGVYISPRLATSSGYARKYGGTKYTVGVVQCNNLIKKSEHISVVSNGDNVRLRYVIVYDPSITDEELAIDIKHIKFNSKSPMPDEKLFKVDMAIEPAPKKELNIGITTEQTQYVSPVSRNTIRQINRQLKKLKDVTTIHECPIKFDYDEDNIQIWKVSIKTKKWGDMVWELRFDDNYPVKPPFVRILKPYFKFRTGHITIGGAICNPILTSDAWDQKITMETLIHVLLVGIEEGGAVKTTQGNYNINDAKTSYKRYVTEHGWTKPFANENSTDATEFTI
jgi:ubiquitin-protein ligase